MGQYLIDTNIVTAFLSNLLSASETAFMYGVIDEIPTLSVIIQIELLCWKTDERKESNVQDFINDSRVLGIDAEVIRNCVELRRKRRMKTPDAVIAATALTYKLTLISNNESDFANIKGLKVVNPYNM
jgi:predicted nucleic acid-binding protein